MNFSYEEITPAVKRPIIPILLKSKTKFVFYQALVDSGADYCIFSIELAELLEIKLSPKDVVKFMGVGKGSVTGYWSKISIKVGSVSYITKVVFAEISDFGHGILGQKGFFDHFDVKLSYKKQLIEVERVKVIH